MGNQFKTEQESFWAGEFGTQYINRNLGAELLSSNLALFSQALRSAYKPKDCIEFGANVGMNLKALKILYPQQEQFAVEINADAANELRTFLPPENVFHASILDYSPTKQFDLVLIKGVLIHINPEYLSQVYETLYHSTGRLNITIPLLFRFFTGATVTACLSVISVERSWITTQTSNLLTMALFIIETRTSHRTTSIGFC